MSKRNELIVLILALLVTIGLVGGGLWLFIERLAAIFNPKHIEPMPSNTLNSVNPVVTLAPSSCNNLVPNVPDGLFSYGGSTTWATIRRDVDSKIQNICPQFRLRYVEPPNGNPGSGTGIRMLIDNQLAFSQSSRSIKGDRKNGIQAPS